MITKQIGIDIRLPLTEALKRALMDCRVIQAARRS